MSLGPIPPVEGRVLEGCDPVTHPLSGGPLEAAEGLPLFVSHILFCFLSLSLRNERKPSAHPCTSVRKCCCFLRSLETLTDSILSKFRVVCSPTGKWRLGCLSRLLGSYCSVRAPLEDCSAPICKQARGTGVEWFAFFFSEAQGMGITSSYGSSERATRYKVDFIKSGNSCSGFLGLGQTAIKKHLKFSKILVILREICP